MKARPKQRTPWKGQIVNGRVFELRSKSKKYPAPCALVIDDRDEGYGHRMVTLVDGRGVVGSGLYTRRHNPHIHVDGLRRKDFTSARILRRRRDLERFDAEDLALIRYGCDLDFDGRIHNRSYGSIPGVGPSRWTAFWIPAYLPGDFLGYMRDLREEKELQNLMRGAWHFDCHGGPYDLGYRFGHVWATRHQGRRARQIAEFLRARFSGLIVQEARVVRWDEDGRTHTREIHRESPALGNGFYRVENGITGNWWGKTA